MTPTQAEMQAAIDATNAQLAAEDTSGPPKVWTEAKKEIDAGWPQDDPFNRVQVEAICRAVCAVEGLDPDDTTWTGDDPPWTRYADAVASALSHGGDAQ